MLRTVSELVALVEAKPPNGENADRKAWRTAKMKEVLAEAEQLFPSRPELLVLIAEKVADEAREPYWRLSIGDSGLLDFYLKVVGTNEQEILPQLLNKHILRLVGNLAADCDENRSRVVASGQLKAMIDLLTDDFLVPIAIPVIYNVCVDYDPAQLQASEAGLSQHLVDILAGERLEKCRPDLNVTARLLGLLFNQGTELKVANSATPSVILNRALGSSYPVDLDTFVELCTAALGYLTYEQFQKEFVTSGKVQLLQEAFYKTYTYPGLAGADSDTIDQLKQVRNASVTVFSDISSLPDFMSTYSLNSPVVRRFIQWLKAPPSFSHLLTTACLSLGNLCRSDKSSTALVNDVLDPLAKILSDAIPPFKETAPTAQLTHAVLSLLKNLAIPLANKSVIGPSLLPHILPQLWTSTSAQPQVQHVAVSLTRLLLVNCARNIREICSPYLPSKSNNGISRLAALMALSKQTDTEPTKMEIARAVCSACRVMHKSPGKDIEQTFLEVLLPWKLLDSETYTGPEIGEYERFYATHGDGIASALASLLIQTRFPAVRSEAIFAMTLMCGKPWASTGGKTVLQALQSDEAVRALARAVTGQDIAPISSEQQALTNAVGQVSLSDNNDNKARVGGDALLQSLGGLDLQLADPPKQPAAARGSGIVDRNGVVLLAEILKSLSNELEPEREKAFEELLRQGIELL
ncbi:GTP binding protein [Podospora didyma]|uniref:GTP binding protein n=1 Tax=Podospora didyma TaxID=330526 RepID=A0AAE0NI07_9PEZI|nr:GTP binding protein [Podospora didyma]